MSYENATREEITELLHRGLSNTAIARQLHCDRHRVGTIRRELGIAELPAQPLSLEEKWRSLVRPVEGGHLEWVGERQKISGTPVMRYRGKSYSPAAIAFSIHHGRAAQGRVFAECDDVKHCVAGQHVDDEAGRAQVREQLRYLRGGRKRKSVCLHGHDQTVHGKYERDGRAYCDACKLSQKTSATA
ncbi:helix-turn-helix domain-containing protein [Streptomyces anulatus]